MTSHGPVISSISVNLSSVWLATQNHSALVSDTTTVPFLPVNPSFSSTRNQVGQQTVKTLIITAIVSCNNVAESLHELSMKLFIGWVVLQGRQKLALFNAKEFATLIIDILNDARRREQDSNPDLTQGITYF